MIVIDTDMFDVLLFKNDQLVYNQELSEKYITTVFNYPPALTAKLVKEAITKGRTLLDIGTFINSSKSRDKLLLIGLKSQIYPTI